MRNAKCESNEAKEKRRNVDGAAWRGCAAPRSSRGFGDGCHFASVPQEEERAYQGAGAGGRAVSTEHLVLDEPAGDDRSDDRRDTREGLADAEDAPLLVRSDAM